MIGLSISNLNFHILWGVLFKLLYAQELNQVNDAPWFPVNDKTAELDLQVVVKSAVSRRRLRNLKKPQLHEVLLTALEHILEDTVKSAVITVVSHA